MVWAGLCAGKRPVWFFIKPPEKPATKKTVNAAVYRDEILLPFIQHLHENDIDPKSQYFMQVIALFGIKGTILVGIFTFVIVAI